MVPGSALGGILAFLLLCAGLPTFVIIIIILMIIINIIIIIIIYKFLLRHNSQGLI